MGRNYLIILIAVGLMAAFAGRLPAPNAAPSLKTDNVEAESSPEASESTSQFAQSSNGQELVLERRGDGHFYADVEINGAPITMLVDTGASAVALSADDARRAGVATSIGMQDVIGQGASGEVRGDIVTLERIRLGGVEQTGVSAAVLSDGSMSLLGQSFLREFDSVEISGDRMHLR
jgi:aspartyl protease family protein